MNKLNYIFLFALCVLTSAPEQTAIPFSGKPDFVCEKVTFAQEQNALDDLLESLKLGEAAQVFFWSSPKGLCFERCGHPEMGPYHFMRDSWRLVGFGLGTNAEFKTMITSTNSDSNAFEDNCVIFHKEEDKINFQFYRSIAETKNIPDFVRSSIDLYNFMYCEDIERRTIRPILENAFKRLAYDRRIKNFLLEKRKNLLLEKRGPDDFYKIKNIKPKKSEYISASTLSLIKMIWVESFSSKLEEMFDDGIAIRIVRPNLVLPHLCLNSLQYAILDIGFNFKHNCDWFGADPAKGLYLDSTGKVSAGNGKIPNSIPALSIPESIQYIESDLLGKKPKAAWIYESKKGEIEIRIRVTEAEEEPIVSEEKPTAQPAEQLTSPGAGSSTDAAHPVVVAVPEKPAEPKPTIPNAAFKEGLSVRASIPNDLTDKKTKISRVDILEGGQPSYIKYLGDKISRKDNEFTELLLCISEGKPVSKVMTFKELQEFIGAINLNQELNVSLKMDSDSSIENPPVIFAVHKDEQGKAVMGFILGRNPNKPGAKRYIIERA